MTALDGHVTPEAVLAAGETVLRPCGLSGSKTASLLDLATHAADGALPLARIGRLSDAEVMAALVPVRGIGPWTAQMFLMFNLGRLDVWPAGDYGVRNGLSIAWQLPKHPTEKEMVALGAPFVGARSLVAWYCLARRRHLTAVGRSVLAGRSWASAGLDADILDRVASGKWQAT